MTEGRPSDAAFVKAGGLLYLELERLAREDVARVSRKRIVSEESEQDGTH